MATGSIGLVSEKYVTVNGVCSRRSFAFVRFSAVGSMPITRQAACPRVNMLVLVDEVGSLRISKTRRNNDRGLQ